MSLEYIKVDEPKPGSKEEDKELEAMYKVFLESLEVLGYDFAEKAPDISKLDRTILSEMYSEYMSGMDEDIFEYLKNFANFKEIVRKMAKQATQMARVGSGAPENYVSNLTKYIKECMGEGLER